MTKLEQQMYDGMLYSGATTFSEMAKEAAKIALELAEKAYNVGLEQMGPLYWKGLPDVTFKQFIQDYE